MYHAHLLKGKRWAKKIMSSKSFTYTQVKNEIVLNDAIKIQDKKSYEQCHPPEYPHQNINANTDYDLK